MKVDRLFFLVIPLLFLSGPFVNAGPVGDFFKKVGQSISRPLQRESQPQPQAQSMRPQPAKTPHATRRSSSRAAPATATTPSAVAESSQPPKEEESTDTGRHVSAANIEKAKAELPYGVPVPGPERHGHESLFAGGRKVYRCYRFCVRARRERSIHRKILSGSVNLIAREWHSNRL